MTAPAATSKDYIRVLGKLWEEVSYEQMHNVWPNHAKSYVRAFWKQEMGRPLPYKIRIGSGNRSTWVHGGVLTVNPRQGWRNINHDMSHYIHWRKTGLSHKGGHMSVERDGARLIKRRFLETRPQPKKVKPEEDLIAKRAASIDRRIVGWEKKLKRAAKALKKLSKQRKYYAKKLLEPRPEPKPRKPRGTLAQLALLHSVEVDKRDYGGYGVWPPAGIEVADDPFMDDHYVDTAKEARERVRVYANMTAPLHLGG